MLMGTVAMVGIVGVSAMNMIGGPITTAAKVTHQNMAQNDLLMNAKVVVMNASTRPQMGDEDSDGYIEPVPFVPVSDPACGITLPTGGEGGCLPADIGAILTDPWGTSYAYCVWDHGDLRSSVNRIDGEDSTSGAVMAIISAGPNKRFETPCLPYDGDPETNDIAINPQGEGDDLVQIYTYAAAVAGSGGLWELKEGEPTTATIAKDIEVEGAFRMGTAGEDPGQVGTSACTQGSHVGRMRFNPFDQAIEVCAFEGGSYEWETLAVAGGSVPVGTISAFAGPACPANWQAVTELQGRMIMGAGSGYTVGQTGGAATVTLTEAQLPSHSHVVDPPSTSTNSAGNHTHDLRISNSRESPTTTSQVPTGSPSGGGVTVYTNDNAMHSAGNHNHSVNIPSFNSGSAGSGQAHENLPPYRAYLFCIYMGGGDGAVAKSFNDLEDVDTSGAQDKDILVWQQGTGQWRPESQWVKDGAKLFYEGGNVGIGTDEPERKMEIVAGTGQNGLAIAVDNGQSGINLELNSANPGDGTRMSFESYRTSDGVQDFGSVGAKDGNLVLSGTGNANTAPHLAITNSGNVGIGTINPQTRLHIESGDNEDTVILGKFNIGTATSAVPVEQAQLILSGAFNAGYNGHAVPMAVKLWIGGYDNDGTVVYPIYVEDENNTPDFWIKNKPGPEALSTAYFQGNVGIGAVNPATKLHIVGANTTPIGEFAEGITAENPSNGTGGTRSILRTDGGVALIRSNDATSGNTNGYIDFSAAPDLYPKGRYGRLSWDDANSAFRFTARYDDGTSPVVPHIPFKISIDGDVGIGTNTPKSALHVSGYGKNIVVTNPSNGSGTETTLTSDGGIRLVRAINASTPEVNGYIDFSTDMDGSSAYARLYYNSTNRELRLNNTHGDASLRVAGNAYKAGGGAWAATSDIRLKNVDGPYQAGLGEILALEPIRFHYKEGNIRNEPSDRAFIGLSAQAVQVVMPDMVSERDDGYLDFDPSALPYALINAVKTLKTENDALRAELAGMQAANDNFRRELDELKSAIGD